MDEKPRKYLATTVARARSVNNIMDDAIMILSDQVERLRLKSRSMSLDPKEVTALKTYVSSLVELSREEREREKADEFAKKLANMSDEELLELANSKLKAVK